MSSTLHFTVGNTYNQIPANQAPLDRTGRHRKVHDWTLYVDVVNGDPDLLDRVIFDLGPSFQPRTYTSICPVPIGLPNGRNAWRFCTRQQTYAGITAEITLCGAGGTKTKASHPIRLRRSAPPPRRFAFTDDGEKRPLRYGKMKDGGNFGIELELSSPPGVNPASIADRMPRNAGQVLVTDSYSAGRAGHPDGWKIVPDGSIVCSRDMPDCNRFELVSRILSGGGGLSEVAAVSRALTLIQPKLQVNRSMGFHVHVDVSEYALGHLVKICQNFIKYEEVMDSFMPPSRRDGSQESRYFRSNRDTIPGATNRERHDCLGGCRNIAELANILNPEGRYYKLNLQNLVTGRQPTLEFRQHSATLNYEKISVWVRFCTAFVHNSARLAAPTPLMDGRSVDFQFRALFHYVIKDRAIRNFYVQRRDQVDAACCNSCIDGDASCATRASAITWKF